MICGMVERIERAVRSRNVKGVAGQKPQKHTKPNHSCIAHTVNTFISSTQLL